MFLPIIKDDHTVHDFSSLLLIFLYCYFALHYHGNYYLFTNTDDHSRVRLKLILGEPGSDYINANFIDVRDKVQLFVYQYSESD